MDVWRTIEHAPTISMPCPRNPRVRSHQRAVGHRGRAGHDRRGCFAMVSMITSATISLTPSPTPRLRLRSTFSMRARLDGACGQPERLGAALRAPQWTPAGPAQVERLPLMICLTCGWVACSDDAPNRHARAHPKETGHPLVRGSPRLAVEMALHASASRRPGGDRPR
jgi:hypothetical protein